ncbi:MAG TPA: hypothetical protein QGG30_10470 [Acidobacteriota bacterium]|nr:hypothetical protein [Acidobacteriota bacterium]|tara:strand:+ start:6852 stop:8258 length:1407 start_codon:yes stop_codon:yes gene_type:complete
MRVLVAGRSVYHFSYYRSVLEALRSHGRELELRFDERWSRGNSDVSLQGFLKENPEVSLQWSKTREDWLREPLFALRELRSYSSYLRRFEQSAYYLDRWRKYLNPAFTRIDKANAGRWLLGRKSISGAIRLLEAMAPAAKNIVADLRSVAPDVVLASPANMRFTEEVEYIKAARHLGIPTAVLVLSWDNMSTKGLINLHPDLLLAWNQTHASEAILHHGISENRILLTGAPFFDKWFDREQHTVGRSEFLRKVGLPGDMPFVLYLGSSANIARDESWLVTDLIKELSKSSTLDKASIMVRPHPANARPFAELAQSDQRVVVWPSDGQLPESGGMQSDFRNSVQYASAIIGINTTAMIDTLALGRPCVAIITQQYENTQMRAQHFQHLFDSGALNVARSMGAAVTQLEAVASGHDDHAEARLAFLSKFLRPQGMDINAGELVAAAVTELGRGTKATNLCEMTAKQILKV